MKTDIIVVGAGGRMGKRLVAAVLEARELKLAGAVEAKGHAYIGKDAGECAGAGSAGCVISDDLHMVIKKGSVIIDFTSPDATVANVKAAREADAKAVIGTTGLLSDQVAEIKKMSSKIPLVFAPNMSTGMNVLFKITRDVARILGREYNVEIVEAHHRFKKDAPSGSANSLAQAAAEGLGLDLAEAAVHGRKGIVGSRAENEIGIHAIRAGDIAGDHTVLFGGMGERLELRHQAHSLDTFARGAIRAALWLADKSHGFFDMQDVLGLK